MQIFRNSMDCEGLDLEISREKDLSRRLFGLCKEDLRVEAVCQGRLDTNNFCPGTEHRPLSFAVCPS